MSRLQKHPVLILALGVVLGAGAMFFTPQTPVKAVSAHGNDKFSMCTVPAYGRQNESVFILDHLTGTLKAAQINFPNSNASQGVFQETPPRQISADFQLNAATPEPKYAIVSGNITNQPGGVVYVGELSSGQVVAYTVGRQGITPTAKFGFRVSVGG